ncbi:hypothetical protein [Rhizorhabdus sp.]|uniref:hypothetical protein n=1 Tax=Rhizorhabdus sp. TaxID=1968843 RepID=UPI00199123F0|nr:hypothetical protein [Rhizorhabdus sp.]MBD3762442.1 hypothetical protein [Rhizorhabdus sp.]
MIVTLIRIDAQDASGGALPIRLSSHDMPEACHLDGAEWDPVLSSLPAFALDFFGGSFDGQVTAPRTTFAFATTGLAAFGATPASRARLADARVRIWVGDITSTATVDLGPLTLRFDGRMTGEPEIDEAARLARCEAAVQDAWADEPLLALFAGTGGIEGPADLTGQPKPLVLGNARFCGGVLIDTVDNVWMVSNGPVQAVGAVYDRLASLGTSAGNFADLAALKAASIPNGSWGTCLAQGLVRLGAPPDGRVSFDVSGSNSGTGGYVRRPGAIIRRIADLAGGTVNAASLAALDTARPYNLQLQLREQVTAREIIGQIADSVAAVAGVSLRGELFAQALAIGASGEALNADDTSALPVAGVEELAKAAPFWRLATEAEPTFELHTAEEAAFSYRWQGEYSAARVYRLDDVVTGPDSAAWAYINATPAAGQSLPVWPVTSNAHWELFQAPGSAAVAPANANRVPFSRMEGDRGWGINFNPSSLAATTSYGTESGLRFFRATVTATAALQNFSIGHSSTGAALFVLPPSTRVSVQARVETTGVAAGPWRLALFGFTASGGQSQIASVSGSGLRALTSAPLQMFVDVPSNIVGGRLEFYCQTTGAGSFSVAIAEPMVTSAASGQTVHPPFTPGPNASDGADPNSLITIDGGGLLQGIGAGSGTPVSNIGVVLSGLLSARPASGQFNGQTYAATDTREFFRWDGASWVPAADITATAQRSIEPQFPVIEIKQGEAGHTGNRTVTHVAKRGTATLTGGTWSLPAQNLGAGSASINASTGTVTLSGIVQSGSYTVRYTHTDAFPTDLAVNVSYVAAAASAIPSTASSVTKQFSTSSFVEITNPIQIQLPSGTTSAQLIGEAISLRLANASPAGSTTVQAKWQRETSPGTWADVGGTFTSSPSPSVEELIDPPAFVQTSGSIGVTTTATGLTDGSVQVFRLVARISAGNVRTVTPFGTVTVGG